MCNCYCIVSASDSVGLNLIKTVNVLQQNIFIQYKLYTNKLLVHCVWDITVRPLLTAVKCVEPCRTCCTPMYSGVYS